MLSRRRSVQLLRGVRCRDTSREIIMPVAIDRSRTPFRDPPKRHPSQTLLRTPQARVLATLMPDDLADPVSEWPVWNRQMLSVKAGFSTLSGTVTRVLNGIRHANQKTGAPHPGILELGYAEEVVLEVEGTEEVNYRATAAGVVAFRAYEAQHGKLPPIKAASTCANIYQGKGETHRSKRGKST